MQLAGRQTPLLREAPQRRSNMHNQSYDASRARDEYQPRLEDDYHSKDSCQIGSMLARAAHQTAGSR